MKLYPKATQNRYKLGQPGFEKGWLFLRAAAKNFALLQILFFGLFAWVFGSLYQQTSHTHNLTVAFVDYDGGAIGAAIREAYSSLQGDNFPALQEQSVASFPDPADLWSAVCGIDYWAALYVSAGASDRLHQALGGGPPALAYNRSDVVSFIWNEVRYSSVIDAAVATGLQTLSAAARVAYSTANGTGQVQSVSNSEALAVFADPWQLQSLNIKPTTQGSRAIYNTIVIILILIQEFLYLGTINGLSVSFSIFLKLHPSRIIVVRNLNSLSYTLVGSLCTSGAIWAFRSGWDVGGGQFMLTWIALWLFAHLNFLTLDTFTSWLPAPYVPMALIAWVTWNVSSILLPFELSPGFYQIGYIFPGHQVYQTLLDIWSGGCNPQLHISLPIMFAWEIFGFLLSSLGIYRKAHYASLGEEEQTRQFDERLDAAMEFQRKREKEVREAEAEAEAAARARGEDEVEKIVTAEDVGRTDSDVRRQLEDVMKRENSRASRERRASRPFNYGLAFDLPFGQDRGNDSDG